MAEQKPRVDSDEPPNDVTENEPERYGDVLGITDAPADVEIPQATSDHSGNPAGIEVRGHSTGTAHLKRSGGAVGVDIGAGPAGSPVAANKDLND